MTDEELLRKAYDARRAAHDAPMAMFCSENKYGKPTGRHFLEDHTNAWADRSNEWMELAREIDRRGLKQPELDYDGDSRRR